MDRQMVQPAGVPPRTGREPGYDPPALMLASGTRLGPYEIVAPLGAGGQAFAERDLRSQLWRGPAVAQEMTWL